MPGRKRGVPVLAVPVLHGEVATIVCTALTLHVLRTFRKGTVPVRKEVRDNVRVGSSVPAGLSCRF